MSSATPGLAPGNPTTITNPNKALWEKGDFTKIADFMRESGEALVKSIGVTPSMRVLDLGCGDGTTAVPLARLGAEVAGIDIARNLVDAGNKRAAALGLPRLKFQEGDACNLQGIRDHSFDLSISIFGAMFAPKPFDVAKEMVRVTKPGGRIVMGNWIPNDPTFVSQLLKISSAFMPPPPEGFISPMTWGRGSERHRAVRPGRSAQGKNFHGQRHILLLLRHEEPGGIHRPVRAILRPDHECLGRGPQEREGCGFSKPAFGTGEFAEPGHRRRHFHSGYFPARDCRALSEAARA